MLAWFKVTHVLMVFLYMEALLPSRNLDDVNTRVDVADGIVEASPLWDDWAILTRIARWESLFTKKAVYCKVRSSFGASGPFQVVPRDQGELVLLCEDRVASARLALSRVAESHRYCRHLPVRERLAQYATGNCGDEGKMMSRLRYATANDMFGALERLKR